MAKFYMKTFTLIASIALTLGVSCACAQKLPNETAPATFRVNIDTSRGPVVIEVTQANARNGADRFYNLVKAKIPRLGARFFRVIPNFMAQFDWNRRRPGAGRNLGTCPFRTILSKRATCAAL